MSAASDELAAQAKEFGEMVQVLVGIVKCAFGATAFGASTGAAHASPRPGPRKAFTPPAKAHGKAVKTVAKAAGADWSAGSKAHTNGHGPAKVALSAKVSTARVRVFSGPVGWENDGKFAQDLI